MTKQSSKTVAEKQQMSDLWSLYTSRWLKTLARFEVERRKRYKRERREERKRYEFREKTWKSLEIGEKTKKDILGYQHWYQNLDQEKNCRNSKALLKIDVAPTKLSPSDVNEIYLTTFE